MAVVSQNANQYLKTIDGVKYVRVTTEEGNPIGVFWEQEGEYFSEHNTVSSLAGGSTTNIINYTVPVGKKLELTIAEASGENRATFRVISNGDVVGFKRTYYTDFNADFIFSTAQLDAGESVQVEVTNNAIVSGDFEATIQGRIIDV